MNKQSISNLQLGLLIIGFLLGTSIIMGGAPSTKRDSWIALIIGGTSGSFLLLFYYYFYQQFPKLNLFQYQRKILGPILGRLVNILYLWFFIHLASNTLAYFGGLMSSLYYQRTEPFILILFLMLTIIYATNLGIEVVARAGLIMIPVIPTLLLLVYVLLWKEYNFEFLLPIAENGIKPILNGALTILAFPYGELIAFCVIFPHLNKTKSSKKVVFISSLFVVIFGIILVIFDTAILNDAREMSLYPLNDVVRLINVLGFFERIDASVMLIWVISVFAKLSILAYSAIIGFADLFNQIDYRPFVIPTSAIILALSLFIFDDIIQMRDFAFKTWPYYALIFELLIPVLLFLIYLSIHRRRS
ncbi:hypothetical protein BHF71_09030 [Vulcanibacillus modesticaldus]|uniref:Uncharacterized protein n=1 Tax=Vulcanibacillus modesticaldus TaxID=337097 RepID=A0A1D2YUQ9_9BACI|nr:endospore germination permease [Vulcanibacillus modesticaldus]OEF99444.1 hypothetical protein BHF71_09030 [Vulcanibacillus modesticaldus]